MRSLENPEVILKKSSATVILKNVLKSIYVDNLLLLLKVKYKLTKFNLYTENTIKKISIYIHCKRIFITTN